MIAQKISHGCEGRSHQIQQSSTSVCFSFHRFSSKDGFRLQAQHARHIPLTNNRSDNSAVERLIFTIFRKSSQPLDFGEPATSQPCQT